MEYPTGLSLSLSLSPYMCNNSNNNNNHKNSNINTNNSGTFLCIHSYVLGLRPSALLNALLNDTNY